MKKKLIFSAAALLAALIAGTAAAAAAQDSKKEKEEAAMETRMVPEGYDTMRGLTAAELISEMKIGWNLGNTMDAEGGETAWGNPKTTQEMIDAVAEKGFNLIRIPVSWGQFTGSAEEGYVIDEEWLDRVGQIVDYALANDMYVIINTHHEISWLIPSLEKIGDGREKFLAIWSQIAAYFADYGDHLIFEGLNEPRVVGSSNEWNGGTRETCELIASMELKFVDLVRAAGGNNQTRLLLLTSEAACLDDRALKYVKVPEDDYVAMSLHAYTPYDFTFRHDGDFDTWNGSRRSDLNWLFGQLDKYFLSKGVPVIITEMGAERKGSDKENNDAEVEKWAKDYTSLAKEKGVPLVWWDNGITSGSGERFGIFIRKSLTWERENVIDAMMDIVYEENE